MHTNEHNYYCVILGSYRTFNKICCTVSILHLRSNHAQIPHGASRPLSLPPDAVTPADLRRVGEKMTECPISLAAMGSLAHVPGKREVEEALRTHGGRLATKKRLFSFR